MSNFNDLYDHVAADRTRAIQLLGIQDIRRKAIAELLAANAYTEPANIDAMTELRDGIGLRAYGNKNPVTEYQIEGYDMFDEMVHFIREDTVRRMYQARINIPQQRREVAEPKETNLEQAKAAGGPSGPKRVQKQVGRNDPCPCGSGKKYKNCCGKDKG